MQPTMTLLLISSSHANWERLRAILRKQRRFQIIGEMREAGEAVCAIAAEQPDVVLAGSDVPGVPIVPLVREARVANPESHIVVIGRLLTRAEHVDLTALGVRGFVLWKDVDDESVGAILALTRRGMRVASEAAMERRDAPDPETEEKRRPGTSDIVLTDEERVVLQGEMTGLGERGIAAALHTSVPTVERLLRGLRDKLGVATKCALCVKAVHLGLVTLDG